MKIIQTSLISLLLFLSAGCAWVSRNYYFESSVKNNEWSDEFRPLEHGSKNPCPATVVFSYTDNLMKLDFDISYENPTCWSPLLIPVIPAPGQFFSSLCVDVTIKANETVSFDPYSWTITDVSNQTVYTPSSITVWDSMTFMPPPLPNPLQKGNEVEFTLKFPVKIKDIETLRISFGPFSGSGREVVPPALLLKKTKGDLQYYQFTL